MKKAKQLLVPKRNHLALALAGTLAAVAAWTTHGLVSTRARGALGPAELATLCLAAPETALPRLLHDLTQQETWFERIYLPLCDRLPDAIAERLPQPLAADLVRLNAAAAVGLLGPKAAPAVPALIGLLKDETADANAAVSLGRIGPAAHQAVPALEAAAQSGPPWLQAQARTALRRIGTDVARGRHGPGLTAHRLTRSSPPANRPPFALFRRQTPETEQTSNPGCKPGNV